MSAFRSALLAMALVACVSEGVQRADFEPCATAVDCRSGRCATAAPGGGYCLPVTAGAADFGLACEAGRCPGGLHCVEPGVRRVCAISAEVPCDLGFSSCGGACVRLDVNRRHCGACGAPCPDGAWCQQGTCRCPADRPLACDDLCVDPATDPDHCGGCEQPCAPSHGAGVCQHGSCHLAACEPGWTRCRGQVGCDTLASAAVEATIHLEPETWHPDHDVLTANAGTPIHLAADSNGDIAAWEWSLAAQPSDAGPRLLANGATAVLHTPLTGEYRVVLDGTTADGTRLCQPAEVTLWVWDTEFERRFEVTWQGPGDLDIHLRRVGGDDAWFGADDCWEGQVGLFGQYECQALHTLGAAGHEVLGLRHFLTEAVEIAVHRGHDGQGGVTEAKVRFYVRLPLGHPALSILYFEGPVSLGEGDLWHVGRWVQGQPLIPWLDTQGEPLVIDYGPRPSPSREGR